jgi:hypothetical protein
LAESPGHAPNDSERARDGRSLTRRQYVTITQRSRNPHRRRSGLAVAAAAVVALALIGAACGDDDDDTAADDRADNTTETTAAEAAAGGDTAAFCDARIGLEQAFNADQPDVQAINGLLEDMQAAAPTELASSVEGLSTALTTAAESGADPTDDPAFAENVQPVDEFALSECGYDEVDVTAVDFSFEGLPETIDAGTVGLKLTNEGSEPHALVVFKFNDGDTTTLEQLLELPEEEVMQHATFAAAAQAGPGSWGASFAELEPGRYAAFCPIPMGGDGPPHFMQGMVAEFTVE